MGIVKRSRIKGGPRAALNRMQITLTPHETFLLDRYKRAKTQPLPVDYALSDRPFLEGLTNAEDGCLARYDQDEKRKLLVRARARIVARRLGFKDTWSSYRYAEKRRLV